MTQIDWMEKYMAHAEQLIYDNRVDEGLKLLDSMLYEEPGYGSLHNHLGWAYLYYTSEDSHAELHLKMAIHFDEGFAAPYLHLGVLYIRLGRYCEAIVKLQEGLTKNGANRTALLQNLGYAYELSGEWRKAIKAYKGAMMASVSEHEVSSLLAGIKRCRRKRLVLFFQRDRSSLLQ
jgi:tetratricopeptide (TPR) repeat protein